MPTVSSGRKAAAKVCRLILCEVCGAQKTLQRHHKDSNPLNNQPENISILCQKCHKEDHMSDGTWGKGKIKETICKVCGNVYLPKRTRRSAICSLACLSVWGLINANKRWKQSQVETRL